WGRTAPRDPGLPAWALLSRPCGADPLLPINHAASLPTLLDQLRHEPRPPRLVARTNTRSVVAVEVFVEEDQVAPVLVGLELLRATADGAAAVLVAQEDVVQAAGDLAGGLPERRGPAGAGGEFDAEVVAGEVVELLQRLDEQEVDGEPDRSAPVR